MNAKIWIDLIKLVLGFALLWAMFAYLPVLLPNSWKFDFIEAPDSLTISVEQEEQLGDFIMENLMSEMAIVEDPSIDSAMAAIESRLLSNLGSTDYKYQILVVDVPQVNALTLPGGNILVFSGLLSFCESPEEVAAVLAHEIGHVEQRHVAYKLMAEISLTAITALLTGGDVTMLHEVGRMLISSVFSRNQEADADHFGMELLVKAQIDPQSMAAFFERLNEEKKDYSQYFEWIMSHPNNNNRIKASMEYEVPSDFQPEPFNLNWQSVQQAAQ
jgi:beta-barrel assembly-enhancing protease